MASAPETAVGDSVDGALPNLVVIGAMKCGTTSLHHYLDVHPDIAMSQAKELNFFFGDDADGESGDAEVRSWHNGNWHRGVEWYAAQFDAGAPVRGEASPGYTSPAHPEVAGRMAAIIPLDGLSPSCAALCRCSSATSGSGRGRVRWLRLLLGSS